MAGHGYIIELDWSEFRKHVDGTYPKKKFTEYTEMLGVRILMISDGNLIFKCEILDDPQTFIGADVSGSNINRQDYETNFQSLANLDPV